MSTSMATTFPFSQFLLPSYHSHNSRILSPCLDSCTTRSNPDFSLTSISSSNQSRCLVPPVGPPPDLLLALRLHPLGLHLSSLDRCRLQLILRLRSRLTHLPSKGSSLRDCSARWLVPRRKSILSYTRTCWGRMKVLDREKKGMVEGRRWKMIKEVGPQLYLRRWRSSRV